MANRNPPEANRNQWTFGELLRWHMGNGTRPDGSPDKPGRRWAQLGLATAYGVESDRAVRKWLSGDDKPDIERIERVLFGGKADYDPWRRELRNAWLRPQYGAAAEPPPPAADPPPPRKIDAPQRCRGRDTETADLIAALTGDKDATIVVLGPGGIGKTTVTRQVLASDPIAARFGARRWFVSLDTVPDAAGLRTAIVLALGLDPADPHAFDRALAVLWQAPGLLVLDNLETPWEGDMLPTQGTLHRLAAVPGLSLMASLRGTAAPSSPAFTHAPTLQPVPDTAARDLFLEIAAGKHATDPLLPRFLAELDGHPLSIELVALRAVTQDDLAELWDQWQKRGPALARHPDLPEGRLTSVIRSIDLSWQSTRLRDPGRLLFRLLGASPAGLVRADREALLGDDAFEAAEDVLRVGLAFARDGRLDLRPPVRGFARTMTPLAPEDEDRWCRHFLALTGEQGRHGGAEAAARLTPALPNLEAAFAAALAESRRVGDVLGEANCIKSLGDIALHRSDHDSARARFEEALPLYRCVGAVLGEANCIQGLGDLALNRSDYDSAQARYEEALPLYRRVGSVLGEANCIKSLGDIALDRSDHDSAQARYDNAQACYEEALPLYRRVGDVLGEANCIGRLGDIALDRSDHDSAQARYEEALPLYRRVGDVIGEGTCLTGLGRLAEAMEDRAGAAARYREALALDERMGATQNIAIDHEDLAGVTEGADRDAHVQAARAAWLSMNLPEKAARVTRRFG